ncbi:hypothetical protein H310_08120 [Aphanomyces invadans]|uniref:RRM Nup35-type domain-containing protein n=1 Tax=Aphanomyces invadans TaxID=157072 RepID=A0A024U1H3_9STRA|nr:hypothetical protein H310_08120 [Aphanomyces invadans]ETV99427.1 hypothetical protein H310_08120 [Aphanomyces invadans]|eukprot:XP_008871983.1 hypothetical protein H310_08120 [Aphanomyces invadans]
MSAPTTDADVMPMFFLNPEGPSVRNKKDEGASNSPTKSSYANLPKQNYQNPWESNGLDRQYQSLRKRAGGADNSSVSSATSNDSTSSIPTNSLFASLSSKLDARPTPLSSSTSTPSSLQFSTLHTQEWGDDELYWVTVFGFPMQDMEVVLSYFQAIGNVAQYRHGRGNWLYLRYQTRLQAEKALIESGSTLGGRVMIGVKRCLAWEMDADAPMVNVTDSTSPPPSMLSRDLLVNPTDVDVMESPRRHDDICSRFLRFLFHV